MNKCYLGDCLDIMRDMPDKCIDLVLTDPPYGIGITGKVGGDKPFGSNKTRIRGDSICKVKEYISFDDSNVPDKIYFDELRRISKNQIIFGGNYFADMLPASSCWLVWDKDNGDNDFADCELCWTSFPTAVRKYKWRWNGLLQEDMAHKIKRVHPTEKPYPLLEEIIRDYSKEGEIIFDGFAGSFSVAHACINTGRKFICVEKDEEYYKMGVERVRKAQAQGKLEAWF